MQTPNERARKTAFREWLNTKALPSNYAIGKWEEAFIAGWNAMGQSAKKIARKELITEGKRVRAVIAV